MASTFRIPPEVYYWSKTFKAKRDFIEWQIVEIKKQKERHRKHAIESTALIPFWLLIWAILYELIF